MKNIYLIIFLFISLKGTAQIHRNEITWGFNGSWFFDDTSFEATRIGTFLLPFNFSYKRQFNEKSAILLDYSWSYMLNGKPFSYNPGRMQTRELHLWQASYISEGMLTDKIHLKTISGLSYRNGGESIYLYSFGGEGSFDYNIYNNLGINLGYQLSLSISSRFNLILEARYIRYFSDFSPNHLNTVFRIGYNF